MKKPAPIYVTRPALPPFSQYSSYLKRIWKSGILTNNGPLVQELEQRLAQTLNVPNIAFLSNGTIALQLAVRALGITGEIITTPFSFVATTSSIVWEGATPVFVDIEPKTLGIDPAKIEAAITKKTQAILGVHVYGHPCDVETIEAIARKHKLHVIYDAAHAYGVTYKGKSILEWGDISTLSFHATKTFHTVEGGAIVTRRKDILEKVSRLRNFGYNGGDWPELGINGKNSEFHAAMGLATLPHWEKNRQARGAIYEQYEAAFFRTRIARPFMPPGTQYNYAYYPVILESEKQLLAVTAILEKEHIYPRRYFYPSLNTLEYVRNRSCPVAESVSRRVLCLPIYAGLSGDTVESIARIVRKTIEGKVL